MSASRQLPSSVVAAEFGEVNVRPTGNTQEVLFTILMEPQGVEAEGWQTGVALDASASMKRWFGKTLKGKVPEARMKEYIRRGLVIERTEDGRASRLMRPQALEESLKRGDLTWHPNTIQELARDFVAYLASNLDADGGTTVIYWACGDGSLTEVVGDFTAEECRALTLSGPAGDEFGQGTRLAPAMDYFLERFEDADRGMYLFLTDGKLDDLAEVKRRTTALAKQIEAGRRRPVKCVLVGVGDEIDEQQMVELDDLDTGTEVDIWDHKVASEMRQLTEIFAEVVDENTMVAPTARIFDDAGAVVETFADGLPARVKFSLPAGAKWFELEVGDTRIRQTLVG